MAKGNILKLKDPYSSEVYIEFYGDVEYSGKHENSSLVNQCNEVQTFAGQRKPEKVVIDGVMGVERVRKLFDVLRNNEELTFVGQIFRIKVNPSSHRITNADTETKIEEDGFGKSDNAATFHVELEEVVQN